MPRRGTTSSASFPNMTGCSAPNEGLSHGFVRIPSHRFNLAHCRDRAAADQRLVLRCLGPGDQWHRLHPRDQSWQQRRRLDPRISDGLVLHPGGDLPRHQRGHGSSGSQPHLLHPAGRLHWFWRGAPGRNPAVVFCLMERTPVILGLTRQAQLWGLPMPYTIGVMILTVLPFIWMDALLWVVTGPIWYISARIATAANPNGAQVLRVVMIRTPHRLSIGEKVRRYV
ncbi:hypothetical protein A6J80_21730 (plasmid) [Paracoccus yeei]|uniref:Uncharacterized protein n=2 Tax=Paracoccus yeei TaxID=147645 RepID=A0A1V0GYL6_9RHOB|nr:hypothetical protein A6J80_21730 [Paracoccus yeei]